MTHDLRTDDADAAPQPITPSNPDAPVRVDVAMLGADHRDPVDPR